MEARTARHRWQWDDTKWIIGLLLVLIMAVATLTAKEFSVGREVTKMSEQMHEVKKTYVPGPLYFDGIDLLRNENKEIVGIIRHDSAAIMEAKKKYDILWRQLKQDIMATRGTIIDEQILK